MAKQNGSNRSGSMGGFIAGVILTVMGLLLLTPILLIVGIVLIVQNRGAVGRKTEKPASYRSAPPKPSAAAVRPSQPRPVQPAPRPVQPARPDPHSYHPNARDHYHITVSGLSVERRLEQLEVMKNAGLLDKEEYEQRRQKILRDR